ncbi:Hypothetical protein SMAX5B_010001 [Xyrichtys novacula]|uniref:NADH dehydrogenase subunit 6 n=1 Tax=Xyrichtys novacula TaxID=13765 RepID=A0AAV1F6T4_XYRNO|nr:Hypothetical protein SMAX5B_010001 [Xyrichtys novacula]
MAAPSSRTTGLLLRVSCLLMLVYIQIITSLVINAGVFIFSDEVLISPFNFHLTSQHEPSYQSPTAGAYFWTTILSAAMTLGLCVPVALVAFALLAMMLAVYAKDIPALWLSTGCQGVSSLLILTGIITFLLLNNSYVSLEHMTLWFYLCVGVLVELVITTALTFVSMRRLKSEWDQSC